MASSIRIIPLEEGINHANHNVIYHYSDLRKHTTDHPYVVKKILLTPDNKDDTEETIQSEFLKNMKTFTLKTYVFEPGETFFIKQEIDRVKTIPIREIRYTQDFEQNRLRGQIVSKCIIFIPFMFERYVDDTKKELIFSRFYDLDFLKKIPSTLYQISFDDLYSNYISKTLFYRINKISREASKVLLWKTALGNKAREDYGESTGETRTDVLGFIKFKNGRNRKSRHNNTKKYRTRKHKKHYHK
jgi:hypothetical protein